MKLIVDTNILFSFFWKSSLTRKILMAQGLQLLAPEFALEEIAKYRQDIMKKTSLTTQEFQTCREELAVAVIFEPVEQYKAFLKPALAICPDSNDVDFFALALEQQAVIWSNDAALKQQTRIRVLSTNDLLNNQEFCDVIFPLDT